MMLTRTTRTWLAALAVAALAFSGCSKDKKDEKPDDEAGEESAERSAPGAESAPKPAAAPSGNVKAALAHLPADSTMLGGFNPADLKKNAQLASLLPMAMSQLGGEYQQFQAQCGINPLTSFDTVVFGGSPEDAFVVVSGYPRSEFDKCLEFVAKEEGVKVQQDGAYTIIEKKSGGAAAFKWVDDTTAIGGPEYTKERLEAHKGGLADNGEVTELLRTVDTSGGLWFVVTDVDMPWDASGVFGTISFARGFKFDVGARLPSADAAKRQVDEITKQMAALPNSPTVDQLKSKLVIKSNAKDLIAQIDLSMQDLEKLAAGAQNDPMVQQLLMGVMGDVMSGMQ